MHDSLYKVWINRFSPTRGKGSPPKPPDAPETPCKCMYFVTKAFSLLEFTGFFPIP